MGLITALILSTFTVAEAASPKAGSSCPKVGTKEVFKGKTFTCVKSGKKLVWNKGVVVVAAPKPSPTPTPSPSPVISASPTPEPTLSPLPSPTSTPKPSTTVKAWTPPTAPSGWNDVIERADGIGYWAWKKTSEKIEASTTKLGKIDLVVSPNGVPDNPTPLEALNLVSRFSAGYKEPSRVQIVYADEKDIEWGQKQIDTFCAERSCGYDVSGEAKKACNVPINPCWGALALRNNRTAIPMIYVTASSWGKQDANHTQGTLEAHEYFHTIQSLYLASDNGGWTRVPRWLIEGGATWVEKATVFHDDFVKYEIERIRHNSNTLFRQKPTSEWIEGFLDPNYTTGWDKWNGKEYDPWAIYDVGSLVSEILVSLRGPNSFLDLFKLTGEGKTFSQSFESIYGMPWKDAVKIIAKTIVAQQK